MNNQSEAEKARDGKANPTNEIFFFLHTKKPIGYILMSHHMNEETFYKQFPNSKKVTKKEFDRTFRVDKTYQVVYVGDDHIIDEHFTEESEGQ